MKKFLFSAAVTAVLMAACSTDNTSPATAPMIKSMTLTSYSSSLPSAQTVNFHYDNGTVSGFDIGTFEPLFTYQNGNLVLTESYDENNILDDHIEYSYVGALLDSVRSWRHGDPTAQVKFHYDGEVLSHVEKFGYQYESGLWVYPLADENFYTWQNGNVLRWDHKRTSPGLLEVRKEFVYDTKNNPFKNMNPTIKYMFSEQWGIMTLSTNNQVSETYFNSFTNPVISPTDSYTQEITYNSDNYPTEIKRYRVSDNTLVSDLSFQYR